MLSFDAEMHKTSMIENFHLLRFLKQRQQKNHLTQERKAFELSRQYEPVVVHSLAAHGIDWQDLQDWLEERKDDDKDENGESKIPIIIELPSNVDFENDKIMKYNINNANTRNLVDKFMKDEEFQSSMKRQERLKRRKIKQEALKKEANQLLETFQHPLSQNTNSMV